MTLSESSSQPVAKNPSHPTIDKEVASRSRGTMVEKDFPEGGFQAWCTVVGAMLAQLCCFGYTASFGVYQDFYTLHYLVNESSSAISWIGSINAFILSALSIVAGMLYDRGYFYHLIIGGSMLESFSLFMLSLAQPGQYYQVFLAQGISLGIAQGLLYIPTMAVISHYFQQRRTLAMSIVSCGSSIGSISHPIMLNYLLNRAVGFANGVRISAAFVSAALLIACLLMRTRIDPPKGRVNYLLVGKGIVHDVPFCLMSVGLLLFQTGFYYPLFYFQLDSVNHRNSETFSFYSLVLLNFGSLFGRLSGGFIAPSIGVTWLIIIATVACGIIILGMISLSGVSTVIVLGTLYGYFSGIYIAMTAPLMALLTNDFSELGARMGIGVTFVGIGGLLGGPIAGALLTSEYKWWRPSLFAGLIALIGCSLLVVMQLLLIRNRNHSPEKGESGLIRHE